MMDRSVRFMDAPKGLLQRRAALIVSIAALTSVGVLVLALSQDDPASPNYPLSVGMGLLAGLGLGVGIAFVWDRHSGRLKRISDVEEATGLPVLGMIPALHVADADRIAVTATQPVEGVEAYGRLAADLVGSLRESGGSCLLITSPTSKAGRTTIAANLAASVAADGMKVALISADPRGGRVDQLLDLEPKPGLMEVLDGSSSLDSALQPSGVDRLSVLAAGAPSGRGVVGYSLDDLARLLDRLTKSVDLVVLEAPPVLGSVEAILLAQEVDLVLMAVDIRRGRRSDASLAVSYLGHVEDSLIGCVANDPGPRRSRHPGDALAPGTVRPERATRVSAVAGRRLRLGHSVGRVVHALGEVSRTTLRAARSVPSGLASAVRLRRTRRRHWLGAIAIAAAVAVVLSSVWWLSEVGRSEAQQETEQTPGAPATAASGTAAVDAAMVRCRSRWDAQAAPLEAAAASLDQWQAHIAAMNRLVDREITMKRVSAFWERTRVKAAQNVERFSRADRTYTAGGHSCRTPDGDRNDADLIALSACQRHIEQREDALEAARVAIGTWHHHVTDMNQLRSGKVSPSRAVQRWLKHRKQGAAELDRYRTQRRQTTTAHC